MKGLLVALICFLTCSCGTIVSEEDGRGEGEKITGKQLRPLPIVVPSAYSEEWQSYITEVFQEYFANSTPLVKKTSILLGQVPEVVEVKCYWFINECDLSISVSFLRLLSSPNELVVALGHEAKHLVNDAPQLMDGLSLNEETYQEIYLEREMMADAFGARFVPHGGCYLATLLLKTLGLVEKEQGLIFSKYAVIVNERIHRLGLLCDHPPK